MAGTLVTSLVILLIVGYLFFIAEGIGTALATLLAQAIHWVQRAAFGIDRPLAGAETLIGSMARVHADFVPEEESSRQTGYVLLSGERWRAHATTNGQLFKSGDPVTVLEREGLVLLIGRYDVHPDLPRGS